MRIRVHSKPAPEETHVEELKDFVERSQRGESAQLVTPDFVAVDRDSWAKIQEQLTDIARRETDVVEQDKTGKQEKKA